MRETDCVSCIERRETFITTSKCSVFPFILFFSPPFKLLSFSFKLLFRCQILYSFCRIKVSEFEIRSILLMLSSFCLTFKAAFFTVFPFDCCSCSSSSLSLFLSRCTFLSFPHTNAMPVLHLSFSTSSLIPLERKTNRSQGRRRKEMKVRNSRWRLMWHPHEMQGVSSLLSLSFSLTLSLSFDTVLTEIFQSSSCHLIFFFYCHQNVTGVQQTEEELRIRM